MCVCVREKGVCQQGVGRKECAGKEERRGGGGHLFEVLFVFLRASGDQRASQLLQTDQLQPLEVNLWAGWVERKLG